MNILEFILNEQQRAAALTATYVENKDEIDNLMAELGPLALHTAFPHSLDFHFTGNKQLLNDVFKILRRNGWEHHSEPPKDHETSWSTFWEKPNTHFKLWISFTSTVCKRVKTGTKLVEQDIYEVQCSE